MNRGAGARLRLLSWNIHKAIGGVDRRCSLERVAAVLSHYRPDVAALQEVDDGVPRSGHQRQHEVLAAALGFRYLAFAPTVRLSTGRYGNATLSHHPILAHEAVDLRFPLKKARGALYTSIAVPAGGRRRTLHLFNWHLGLSGLERRWQVRRLLASRRCQHLDRDSRVVLAGDSNDWAGALAGGRLLDAGFGCATGTGASALRTFPAWAPVGALDRIFLRGALRCAHVLRPRLDLAARASDHLPVVVDLQLLPG